MLALTSSPLTGHIQVSETTHSLLLAGGYCVDDQWRATGGVEIKGKGVMNTFVWEEGKQAAAASTLKKAPDFLTSLRADTPAAEVAAMMLEMDRDSALVGTSPLEAILEHNGLGWTTTQGDLELRKKTC